MSLLLREDIPRLANETEGFVPSLALPLTTSWHNN